jgi:crossover junction endonuclease EME1
LVEIYINLLLFNRAEMSFLWYVSEQSQYRNPSSFSWRRPPVEEVCFQLYQKLETFLFYRICNGFVFQVLSKIATHYARVHSRQCADEAEVAEHVVGLTSSLANCKFRQVALLMVNLI